MEQLIIDDTKARARGRLIIESEQLAELIADGWLVDYTNGKTRHGTARPRVNINNPNIEVHLYRDS